MISVAEAKKIIREQIVPLQPVELEILEAAGLVLAKDVYATTDIPAFRQSSMDGYAISFSGWQAHKKLRIAGEVPAGSNRPVEFSADRAVRIFTGAPVPEGADTVVMQEKISLEDGQLIIIDESLTAGSNVRSKGSEIREGALALAAGTVLSPAAIGFLAGIGVTRVLAHRRPKLSIIVTGDELQQPGLPLAAGQVYESNSYTLKAALWQAGVQQVKLSRVVDDLPALAALLEQETNEADVVLFTGGISVGDYDFVLNAANQVGVSRLFHRVKQRPGKPLYAGKKNDCLVFGLPGNPSSVLTCFYEYVLPALQALSNGVAGLKTIWAPLNKTLEKNAGLTHFLKGWYDGECATILDAQESYRLSSFARANCLVVLEEGTECVKAGEKVEIHLLP